MGSLTVIQGDLFTADTDAVAQGCNCRGAMGAGIALQFRKRYPGMYAEYKKLCEKRLFSLGSVFEWQAVGSKADGAPGLNTIYNLGTQKVGGPNADPFAIALAFEHMADRMWKNRDYSVGLPLIGAGIGGLSWSRDVRPLAEKLAERVDVNVYYLDKKDLN